MRGHTHETEDLTRHGGIHLPPSSQETEGRESGRCLAGKSKCQPFIQSEIFWVVVLLLNHKYVFGDENRKGYFKKEVPTLKSVKNDYMQ